MVKVRIGKDLGIDLEKLIGWTLVENSSSQHEDLTSVSELLGYPIPTSIVEERLFLFTSGETLVVTKAGVGSQAFTNLHNLLLSSFNIDINVEFNDLFF
jgi:hypothetical protein